MRYTLFLLLVLLIFSCSNPNRKEFTKDIHIDWTNQSRLHKLDILYVQLNFSPFSDEDIMGKSIEEFTFENNIYALPPTNKSQLIEIISDSSNFSTGECGTFALNAGFLFLENDTIKGIIEMGCGCSHWGFEPWNKNARDGSLSDSGFEKMTELLDDIHLKTK